MPVSQPDPFAGNWINRLRKEIRKSYDQRGFDRYGPDRARPRWQPRQKWRAFAHCLRHPAESSPRCRTTVRDGLVLFSAAGNSRPNHPCGFCCTPARTHIDLVEEALANGKYAFCEKPLDEDLAKARRFVEADLTRAASVDHRL